MYKKLNKNLRYFSQFGLMKWSVTNEKVKGMSTALSNEERKYLEFDMKTINWPIYFKGYAGGLKQYFCKEDIKKSEKCLLNYRRYNT